MRGVSVVVCVLLAASPAALSRHDEDFAFDNSDEVQSEGRTKRSETTNHGLRRLWGVPDTTAYVGHLFRMEIPKEAFSGPVTTYKIRGDDGRHPPSWLVVDSRHGLVSGVPLPGDVGPHAFTVTARGPTGDMATDSFIIEVKKPSEMPHAAAVCTANQPRLVLALLIDAAFPTITAVQRTRALMNLASFMALDGSELSMEPYKPRGDERVVLSGPGDSGDKTRSHGNRRGGLTAVYLNVGCGTAVWSGRAVLVAGARTQARDGSLSHVARLPFAGWRLLSLPPRTHVAGSRTPRRDKREKKANDEFDMGSGYPDYDADGDGDGEGDDDDYSGYGDNGDNDYNVDDSEDRNTNVRIDPVDTSAEESNDKIGLTNNYFEPSEPTATTEEQTVIIRASDEVPTTASTSPSTPPAAFPSPRATDITTELTSATTPSSSSVPVSATTEQSTFTPETTITDITEQVYTGSSERTSMITGTTTWTVMLTPQIHNSKPVVTHQLRKVQIFTGKAFKYIIPADLFNDPEDGEGLKYQLLENDSPLASDSWVQFNASVREVYGLPLEPHVARHFTVRATDNDGASADTPLDITVEQHKSSRTPNHQFTLTFILNESYKHAIDWQIKALEGIVNLFRVTDMDKLIVLDANQAGTVGTIVWMNDTLPNDRCPTDEVKSIMQVLESSSESGQPSAQLSRVMSEELTVTRVSADLLGLCASQPSTPVATDEVYTASSERTNAMSPPVPNNKPVLTQHMRKLQTFAGRYLTYQIPADLFNDPEDGNELTFQLLENETPLTSDSWLQFNASTKEVYGLPLESQVSRWHFVVRATDSGGESADAPLDITVQQHKARRTVNHQFTLSVILDDTFQNAIDWQIKVLKAIVQLFPTTNIEKLTVLNATQAGNVGTIVWTNDSLPRPECPTEEVKQIMQVLQSTSSAGQPSLRLSRAVSPLSVTSVRGVLSGSCAPRAATPPAPHSPDTYPPSLRNPVDHITAVVGSLLIFKIPQDTFFDPEDGDTRSLKLSLRQSGSAAHWLQFDANNQEIYGLPLKQDIATLQYQLVAEDSSKKTSYDSLVVEVVKAPAIKPTVEFHMQLDIGYEALANSASNKRMVVENLVKVFGGKESYIRIESINNNPTTIVWYNTSLPMDRCPKKEIEEVTNVVVSGDRNNRAGFKDGVDKVFDKMKVMSFTPIYLGLCADQNTKVYKEPKNDPALGKAREATRDTEKDYTEYLVTFVIPVVVIVCMILVAGVIACVLYRRRRTGKMSMGDEEERQAFRSKGIPVIFQDELEEQAGATEPLHKSPVIMREEKPPLLPPAPQYRSAAYRAPPPPAASAPPTRPKPAPVYRKPPPYVPP